MAQNLWIDSNYKPWAIGLEFDSGETVTVTPGTPVLLLVVGTETLSIVIMADPNNTDRIHIGPSDVNYSTNKGLQLVAGQGVTFDIDNSKKAIYIDSGTTAQKVSWLYITGRVS